MQVLQNTRQTLAQRFQQIPQLSVGGLYNLNQPVNVSNPCSITQVTSLLTWISFDSLMIFYGVWSIAAFLV